MTAEKALVPENSKEHGWMLRKWIALVTLLKLAACTSVPFETDRVPDRAVPPGGTSLDRTAAFLGGEMRDGQIAMAPLADGNDALGARLRMIERAESSIDLKTFLIKPDTAGALIWVALYEAAERGVKIRLLYDDVFTKASDDDIASLDTHPNVEIRSFNPLSRQSTTAVNFILDFDRVNRRMHNKAMIVDGVVAIIGGRNIADEYFQIETSSEFADFDLFIAGAPVQQLSEAFDLYWNDPWSVRVARLSEGDDTPLREALAELRAGSTAPAAEVYRRAVDSKYLSELRQGRVPIFRGTGRVVVDDPEKLRTPPGKGPFIIGDSFYNTLMRAKSEVLVITPYFVPEPYGAEVFADLVSRGVRVRVLTNSLTATNHPYVHGGYAPYRNELMKAGVEFLEVRADSPRLISGSTTPLVLHSKLAIIDREVLFVGSTNVDPRSIRQNTELGMVIESPGLARNILTRFDGAVEEYTFAVEADSDGKPRWRYTGSSGEEAFTSEPDASFWRKAIAKIAGWLPIEQQL